jgi:hypothetical protein
MKFNFVKWAIGFLESWKQLTDTLERVLVGNIAASVPWLASTIPAWLAYNSMVNVLHIFEPVAFIGGLTVEGLGISTVNTAVKFWQHNRERSLAASRQSRRKTRKSSAPLEVRGLAPINLAIGMAAFYFTLVILLNVVLDPADFLHKFGNAMLSLLSPVGAVTIALNAEFAQLLSQAEQKRKERKDKSSEKVAGKLPKNGLDAEKVSGTSRQFMDWRKVPPSERLKMVNLSKDELKEQYHLPDKTASNWFKWLREDKGQAGEIARFRDSQATAPVATDGAEL